MSNRWVPAFLVCLSAACSKEEILEHEDNEMMRPLIVE